MSSIFTWLKSNLVYFIFAGFVGCYYWFYIRRTHVMQQRGKYTVGYVTGWTQTLKSGRSIDYRCLINGTTYTGSNLEEKGMNSAIGARYLVEYDSLEPSVHNAYYSNPIAPSIKQAPVNGWSKSALVETNDTMKLVASPG